MSSRLAWTIEHVTLFQNEKERKERKKERRERSTKFKGLRAMFSSVPRVLTAAPVLEATNSNGLFPLKQKQGRALGHLPISQEVARKAREPGIRGGNSQIHTSSSSSEFSSCDGLSLTGFTAAVTSLLESLAFDGSLVSLIFCLSTPSHALSTACRM